MVDFSSNGSLSTDTIHKALKFFKRVATTLAMWALEWIVQNKVPGVYEMDINLTMSAKIYFLFHKFESIS